MTAMAYERPPAGSADDAVASTTVVEERGRFIVLLDVVFPDTAVRHRVGDYPTRAKAELAARLVLAAAERSAPRPPGDPS